MSVPLMMTCTIRKALRMMLSADQNPARDSAALCHLGLTDAVRAFHPQPHLYSYWDYQAGRWNRDEGLRIDHLLLSPQAADHLAASGIDKEPRKRDKPSDHTPVWCELSL